MSDTERFEKAALPHLDAVYRAALALCQDVARAEDLAQQTFVKALSRFNTFHDGTQCRAWLLRILRNTWIDELRHRKVVGTTVPVEEALLAADEASDDSPENFAARDVLEDFSDEQVIRALRELPDEQRLALYLTDVEQMNQDEIAEITNVAVGTVKSRASRARAALKRKLTEHARDLGFLGRREWRT